MPKLPFVHTPKLRHVAIGNESSGILWMIEKGGISPAESPIDVMEEQSNRMKAARIYTRAQERLAESRKISIDEAKRLLYGIKVKQEEGEDIQVELDGVTESWDSWMQPEELVELLKIQGNQEEFEIRVATLLIRYRVLYPVFLAGPANPELKVLSVKPLSFPINAGDVIDFEQFKVTASKFADEGSEVIEVEKIPGKLKAESYGFLLESPGKKKAGCFSDLVSPSVYDAMVSMVEGKNVKPSLDTQNPGACAILEDYLKAIGSIKVDRAKAETIVTEFLRSTDSSFGWTEFDTRLMDPKLIHDIYRLYCREMGLDDPDLPPAESEESSAPLELGAETETTKNRSRSNGSRSTTDSDTLELLTTG